MKISDLDTYEMYLAIKTHFTDPNYDFFEYKGRLKKKIVTYEKFAAKNYYLQICKLSRKYEAKELVDYFVSNMLVNEGEYIFDIDAEGKRIYTDYLRRKDSRTYIFKQDINRVCMELEKLNKTDFWDSIEVGDGQHPFLFRMFVGSYLSPETMCILLQIKDYLSLWDANIKDTVFYPVVSNQIRKLNSFIRIKDHSPFIQHIESTF